MSSPSSKAALRTFSTRPRPEESDSRPCPLCGGARASRIWRADGAEFCECASCGLWRQDPQPRKEGILARYGDEYLAYETSRHLEYRAISLKSLAEAGLEPGRPGPGRAVLEIGCATGALLSAFAEAGWEAVGIEAGASMAEYARRAFGLDVRHGTIEDVELPPAGFDAVVATHLIEHLNEPRRFLSLVRRSLKDGGKLYLITPNSAGLQPALLGERWRSAIRDHLYLFSRKTLRAMLASEGLAVEYAGTWGGWPAGMRPAWLKRPVDAAAKLLGLGDVMVVRAAKAREDSDAGG